MLIDSEELIIDSYTPEKSRIFNLHGIDIDKGQYNSIDFDIPAKEIAKIEDKRILEIVKKKIDKK